MQPLHNMFSFWAAGDMQRFMLALYMRKKNKKQNRLGSSSNHVLFIHLCYSNPKDHIIL